MTGENPVAEFICGAAIGTALTMTACYLLRPKFTPRKSKDPLVRDFM